MAEGVGRMASRKKDCPGQGRRTASGDLIGLSDLPRSTADPLFTE